MFRNSLKLIFTDSLYLRLIRLTRSLREPGGPCTKSMEVSESRMERVKAGALHNNNNKADDLHPESHGKTVR